MSPDPGPHDDTTSTDEPVASTALNRIDAVDVRVAANRNGRSRAVGGRATLFVHLCRPIKNEALPQNDNVRIMGRGRTHPLIVIGDPGAVDPTGEGQSSVFAVTLDDPGDGLPYDFSLVEAGGSVPFHGFDPKYASIVFRFRGDCATEADCGTGQACLPAPRSGRPDLEIDYLAKDYASFRRVMLDRLAETVPAWSDRFVPDLGITLVEVLAYAADHLSYYQDAVATEAYLDTARRRVSVRRHARLVDYPMHDGCNARTWISVCVSVGAARPVSGVPGGNGHVVDPCAISADSKDLDTPLELDPENLYFFTDPSAHPFQPPRPQIKSAAQLLEEAETDRVVFAPVVSQPSGWQALLNGPWPLPVDRDPPGRTIKLYARHNTIGFSTAAGRDACLRRGATTATLIGPLPQLRRGDVLIFEEILGPQTEIAADADPAHRHAVRLRRVVGADQPQVEVEWFEDDALPFPLCLRGASGKVVSVARGNVILVDHGLWRPGEELKPVAPLPPGLKTRTDGLRSAWRYQPLSSGPPTQTVPFPDPAVVASVQAGYLASVIDRCAVLGVPAAALCWPLEVARKGGALVCGPIVAMLCDTLDTLPVDEALGMHPWREEADEAAGALDPLLCGPATAALTTLATAALPALIVRSAWAHRHWRPRRDLLGQVGDEHAVVVEVDDEGRAHLRFDDETPGQSPLPGEPLLACYRIGNGAAGNVGADRVSGVVSASGPVDRIASVRNPLAASGGTNPESAAVAKQMAPTAFRDEPLRAITAEDYAARASRDPRVQKAAAQLIWNGTGFEARVVLDLKAQTIARYGAHVDRVYLEVEADLRGIRRVGHDVRVVPARMVPLLLQLRISLQGDTLRVPVESALRTVLGAGLLPDGRKALFHPDHLTFGSPIAASRVVSVAQQVTGVVSAVVERLKPLYADEETHEHHGVLTVGALEIPELDDDPNAPERGQLIFCFEGGR